MESRTLVIYLHTEKAGEKEKSRGGREVPLHLLPVQEKEEKEGTGEKRLKKKLGTSLSNRQSLDEGMTRGERPSGGKRPPRKTRERGEQETLNR